MPARIDLSHHPNPSAFLSEAQTRYPDSNVEMNLCGNTLEVVFGQSLPLQIQMGILDFLQERAKGI